MFFGQTAREAVWAEVDTTRDGTNAAWGEEAPSGTNDIALVYAHARHHQADLGAAQLDVETD